MIFGSNQKLLMARAGVKPSDPAWNVDNASYSGNSFSVVAENDGPSSVFFKPDGTEMYICGGGTTTPLYRRHTIQYSLSTAWDMTTATFTRAANTSGQVAIPGGVWFKPDGTGMYLTGDGFGTAEYTLSTAWDISTLSFVQKNVSVDGTGIFLKSDGTSAFFVSAATDTVDDYSLGTAWDISSASFVQSISVPASEATPQDVFFKSDGTKMYIVGYSVDRVYQYSLSTAWDISTAGTPETDFVVSPQDTFPTGLFFKDDGTQFWVMGDTNNTVYAYDIG